MTQRMLKLIREYQFEVAQFISAFQSKFGVDDLLRAWRANEVAEQGMLDDAKETRYRFHGTGCRVESTDGVIDFDFGPNRRIDGFDGWRLSKFAESRPDDYPEFQRHEIVESVLGDLVVDGIVVRPCWWPSPHLCYFRDACDPDDIATTER